MGLFDNPTGFVTDSVGSVGKFGRSLFGDKGKGGGQLSLQDTIEEAIANEPKPDPITGRLAEETAIINEKLKDSRKFLGEREDAARKKLGETTSAVGQAIDNKLAQALEDTGFQVGEAVQGAGIGQAARGIGRSTFATEQVGNIFQAGDEQRGQLRAQASAQKRSATAKAQGAARSIADKRISVTNRLRDLERQGLQSAQFQQEIQAVQQDFEKMIADANLPAESVIDSLISGDLFS